jgi:undecaprenyl-phosphate 4-deoxy-4-formamido-L-arabinose transferase
MARLVLGNALGIEIASSGTGFRAFHARLRDAFADHHGPSVVIDLLLTWGTTRFAAIPVRHDRRKTARSNYSFLKLGLLTLDAITGLSARPIRIAGVIGFGFVLIGLVGFFYASVRYFAGGAVLSVGLIISAVAFFSGA